MVRGRGTDRPSGGPRAHTPIAFATSGHVRSVCCRGATKELKQARRRGSKSHPPSTSHPSPLVPGAGPPRLPFPPWQTTATSGRMASRLGSHFERIRGRTPGRATAARCAMVAATCPASPRSRERARGWGVATDPAPTVVARAGSARMRTYQPTIRPTERYHTPIAAATSGQVRSLSPSSRRK